jgi:prophage tail gpP-like protein
VKRGQQYARALQDVVQTYRLVLTDNGFGEASLISITDESAAPVRTFEAGMGVIQAEIDMEVKMTQLYSRYLVRGQRELVENEVDEIGIGLVAGGVRGLTERETTKVFPSKVTSTKLDAQQYAEWQAKMALSKAYRLSFTISDWDSDVGDVVNVIDDEKGIDEAFVIESVRFTDAPNTQEHSALGLTLPTAYSFRPLRKGTTQRTDTWQIKKRAARGLKVALDATSSPGSAIASLFGRDP